MIKFLSLQNVRVVIIFKTKLINWYLRLLYHTFALHKDIPNYMKYLRKDSFISHGCNTNHVSRIYTVKTIEQSFVDM